MEQNIRSAFFSNLAQARLVNSHFFPQKQTLAGARVFSHHPPVFSKTEPFLSKTIGNVTWYNCEKLVCPPIIAKSLQLIFLLFLYGKNKRANKSKFTINPSIASFLWSGFCYEKHC